MIKRITISIEDELLKKLHRKQAKLIKESTKSVSLSSVIKDLIKKNI